MRKVKRFTQIESESSWKHVLARITDQYHCLLNLPNGDFILAWGNDDNLTLPFGAYEQNTVQRFVDKHKDDYIFGCLSYDIKNNETRNIRNLYLSGQTSDITFFVPTHVVIVKGNSKLYFGSAPTVDIEDFLNTKNETEINGTPNERLTLKQETSKENYINNIYKIKTQIQDGMMYEMNYCVNFQTEYKTFNPCRAYLKLCKNARAPFSCFFSDGENIILSGSPERFLCQKGNTLFSQPIKGTAKRGESNLEDENIKRELRNTQKEISENVMIVDLVRNDLSKIAKKNSVSVDELCKVYSFKTVHQLISKVSCQIKSDVDFSAIIQALFPMGSMTGAPKISAIQNINHFESFNRGIYSGSIGYIDPNGNFDFNVVIRTIVDNQKEKKLSVGVGGAITINSDPQGEFEECLLKLKAIQETLC